MKGGSEASTACTSEVLGFSSSVKSSKFGEAQSASSGLVMQDLGEEEDDLERMFEDEELDEELFAHEGNPCNGLRRQGNIGETQVFGSAPIMAPQGKFQLWNSDVLVSK